MNESGEPQQDLSGAENIENPDGPRSIQVANVLREEFRSAWSSTSGEKKEQQFGFGAQMQVIDAYIMRLNSGTPEQKESPEYAIQVADVLREECRQAWEDTAAGDKEQHFGFGAQVQAVDDLKKRLLSI